MTRAVFLDRDGVLNEALLRDGKPYPPPSADQVVVCPDAPAALRRLKELGFRLLVVTNQPDVARGSQTAAGVEAIHDLLRGRLPLDAFFSCYHDDRDDCACRKPRPGLILEAARAFGADLAGSFMVGDRWRDIDAGRAAGCRTVWIDREYHERGPSEPPSARVRSLLEAAAWIEASIAAGPAR
jgi:D-glycero-D-manno-heptose 1,7-bisphosphate phosphatase